MWWRTNYRTLAEARENPSTQSVSPRNKPGGGFRGRFGGSEYRAGFGTLTSEAPSRLLAKVYGLLAFSFAVTAAGAILGYRLEPFWILLTFPVAIGLTFLISRMREVDGWNVALLYTFCLWNGLLIGTVLAAYAGAGMTDIVIQAGVATAAVTISMSFIGLVVRRDLSSWSWFLYTALVGLLGVFVANLFIGESLISFFASAFAVVLFSVFLIFDTSRIRHTSDTMGNAVILTLDIYLDIINLFLNLLSILAELSGDD